MKKDFLSITDLTKKEIISLINLSIGLKEEMIRNGSNVQYLKNKTLTMYFEKPSLRTRISFETAMTQLGGHAINLSPADIGIGKREIVSDIAKVISSMTNIIIPYVFGNYDIQNFGPVATIILIIFIVYAILKHHLFNIKVVTVECPSF